MSSAEVASKEQVERCINLETSFINMNHPDFKERVRRGAGSGGQTKPELLRKGTVIIVEGAKGGIVRDAKKLFAKDMWVVVTTTMFVIFKDKTEDKQINAFRTQGLKIEQVDNTTFTVFDPDGDKAEGKRNSVSRTSTHAYPCGCFPCHAVPYFGCDSFKV